MMAESLVGEATLNHNDGGGNAQVDSSPADVPTALPTVIPVKSSNTPATPTPNISSPPHRRLAPQPSNKAKGNGFVRTVRQAVATFVSTIENTALFESPASNDDSSGESVGGRGGEVTIQIHTDPPLASTSAASSTQHTQRRDIDSNNNNNNNSNNNTSSSARLTLSGEVNALQALKAMAISEARGEPAPSDPRLDPFRNNRAPLTPPSTWTQTDQHGHSSSVRLTNTDVIQQGRLLMQAGIYATERRARIQEAARANDQLDREFVERMDQYCVVHVGVEFEVERGDDKAKAKVETGAQTLDRYRCSTMPQVEGSHLTPVLLYDITLTGYDFRGVGEDTPPVWMCIEAPGAPGIHTQPVVAHDAWFIEHAALNYMLHTPAGRQCVFCSSGSLDYDIPTKTSRLRGSDSASYRDIYARGCIEHLQALAYQFSDAHIDRLASVMTTFPAPTIVAHGSPDAADDAAAETPEVTVPLVIECEECGSLPLMRTAQFSVRYEPPVRSSASLFFRDVQVVLADLFSGRTVEQHYGGGDAIEVESFPRHVNAYVQLTDLHVDPTSLKVATSARDQSYTLPPPKTNMIDMTPYQTDLVRLYETRLAKWRAHISRIDDDGNSQQQPQQQDKHSPLRTVPVSSLSLPYTALEASALHRDYDIVTITRHRELEILFDSGLWKVLIAWLVEAHLDTLALKQDVSLDDRVAVATDIGAEVLSAFSTADQSTGSTYWIIPRPAATIALAALHEYILSPLHSDLGAMQSLDDLVQPADTKTTSDDDDNGSSSKTTSRNAPKFQVHIRPLPSLSPKQTNTNTNTSSSTSPPIKVSFILSYICRIDPLRPESSSSSPSNTTAQAEIQQ